MLDARQIRLIVTVAEHGNLVRAGRVLGMSPSALTRAITSIEDRLTGPLFDRSRRGFEPTAIGRAVVSKGVELLVQADELSAMIGHLRGAQEDSLVISAGPLALETVVGSGVADFMARRPSTQVRVTGGSAVNAVRELMDRRAALAVAEISDLDHPEELAITPLRRHPMFILVRTGHPLLLLGGAVTASEIFRYPIIMPPFMPARFARFVAAGLEAVKHPSAKRAFPGIITESVSASLSMAALSDAVTASTAQGALNFIRTGDVAVLPWRPSWLETNFGMMHLRAFKQSPPCER